MDPEGSQNIEAGQAPILEPGHTLATVTDKISSIVLGNGTTQGLDDRLSRSPRSADDA